MGGLLRRAARSHSANEKRTRRTTLLPPCGFQRYHLTMLIPSLRRNCVMACLSLILAVAGATASQAAQSSDCSGLEEDVLMLSIRAESLWIGEVTKVRVVRSHGFFSYAQTDGRFELAPRTVLKGPRKPRRLWSAWSVFWTDDSAGGGWEPVRGQTWFVAKADGFERVMPIECAIGLEELQRRLTADVPEPEGMALMAIGRQQRLAGDLQTASKTINLAFEQMRYASLQKGQRHTDSDIDWAEAFAERGLIERALGYKGCSNIFIARRTLEQAKGSDPRLGRLRAELAPTDQEPDCSDPVDYPAPKTPVTQP